jgi:predicted RNA binding protein with dsRBD fold (UPF0201 family)
MIKISAYLKFYPTEDRDKLVRVLQHLMPIKEENITEEDKQEYKILRGSIEGLNGLIKIFEGFRKQRTVQSAHKVLMDKLMYPSCYTNKPFM